ncbi:MAG: 50S ribosomal protein L11 methyltransferase [Sulfobacillus acidophilus]|uniref:50S ribosomal protein L11 methyltransferase n=1 Tax=Sulfobacillus acidophilus TaxID=53633 RepID=A0A2T2WN16_9FIRM|nr:MAG: 50S ribosomal protein L11 methyltransferase [Sulfobacillus acidophilus]
MPWADNRQVKTQYWRVTWYPPYDEINQALDVAQDLAAGGFEYEDGQPSDSSPFTDIPLEPGRPFVRVYFPSEKAQIVESLCQVCEEHGWAFQVESVYTEDWANAWKAYYHPILIPPDYAIVPAWYDTSPKDAEHTLWIDPGMAFGTGTHATTRMCLEFLASADLHRKTLLDLGAGSGILGLFGLMGGAERAVLVEPDPVAIQAIFHNAGLNHCDRRVAVVPGTLADLSPERFDVVCMNLIWDIIQTEWMPLQQYLAPGALVLLSGLLAEHEASVRRLLNQTNHTVLRAQVCEGWLLMVTTHDSPSH